MPHASSPAVPRTHHAVVVAETGGPEVLRWTQADVPAPSPTLVRDDLEVPVLVFTSETDIAGGIGLTDEAPDYFISISLPIRFDLPVL